MWTLPDNFKTEWTPRTRVRPEPEPVGAVSEDDEVRIGIENGQFTPLTHVVLAALDGFGEAKRAVADALSRYLPGGSP